MATQLTKKETARVELIEFVEGIEESAANDAGWPPLDGKPYPSDPKLRNCERVGAFVGSLRAQHRTLKKMIARYQGRFIDLLDESKSDARDAAKREERLGNIRVQAIAARNGGKLTEVSAGEARQEAARQAETDSAD